MREQLAHNEDRYSKFHNREIDKQWTSVFAIDRYFVVLNGRIT